METVEELSEIAQYQRDFGNSDEIDDLNRSLLAVASTDPLVINKKKLSSKFQSQVILLGAQARLMPWENKRSEELQVIDRSCNKLAESLAVFNEHLEDVK